MHSPDLAVATLVSWLVTEALGLYMLRSWIASGGVRQRPGTARTASRPVLFGHAGLALSGFVCWVSYLASGAVALAWLAICLLGPAIGLGISTLTVWTPFPSHRMVPEEPPARPARIPDEALARALDDEALAGRVIDDLLTSIMAGPRPAPRRKWDLEPLVPISHGIMAITTFLLATLAAVAALS